MRRFFFFYLFILSFSCFVSGCGFCALFGLQNLTPGTPRFTHFHASLYSYESVTLGIPGLWNSFIDITSAMLAGNDSPRTSSFATSYVFLTVDFVCPFGLQNLTPGTKRCSMIYASLCSFKS